MYKLYGHAVSNYFNTIKLILLEKGLEFEEVHASPSQLAGFLEMSPMGKIPVLETPRGFISETSVVLDYLEEVHPEIPMYPTDPFEKAMAKRLCHMAEVYIDLSMRPVFMKDLIHQVEPESRRLEIRQELVKGARAISTLAQPSPWMMGEQFTAADIVLYFALLMMMSSTQKHLDLNVLEIMPGYTDWYERVADRELVRKVSEDIEPAREGMLLRIKEILEATGAS